MHLRPKTGGRVGPAAPRRRPRLQQGERWAEILAAVALACVVALAALGWLRHQAHRKQVNRSLAAALDGHDLRRVEELVGRGAAINTRGEGFGYTPLIVAAKDGATETVEALLARGAQVNVRDEVLGYSALLHAARGGHTGAVKALLAAGAAVDLRGGGDVTALMVARNEPVARLLLRQGAHPHLRDATRQTALMSAAKWGKVGVAKALLENGADVNAADAQGRTALMKACGGTAPVSMVELLLARGADVNARDRHGRTALEVALRSEQRGIARVLLRHGASVR